MARPQKVGIDYFPMDCHLDKNLKAIIRKFKAEGFGVVVGLYQHIYSDGYWIKWTSEVAEDFSLEIGVNEDLLSDIISFCVKREIFNSKLYKSKKVLTSRGIQKRYLNAIERRKCKHIPIYNLINDDNNSINDDNSTQSKEKKSKEKDIYTNWDSDRLWVEIDKANKNRFKNHGSYYSQHYLEWFFYDMISITKKGKLKFQERDSFLVGGLLSNWAKQGYYTGGSPYA